MGQRNVVAVPPVVAHQQPAGEPLLDRVHRIGQGGVGRLQRQRLHVAQQEAVQAFHRGGDAATDPFLIRLRLLTKLGDTELAAFAGIYGDKRYVRAKAELVAQGEHPRHLHVLLDGWAHRYRLLADGRRQITQVLVPGDICDLDVLHVRTSDFAVATLTACTVVAFDKLAVNELALRHPRINKALGWLGAVENAMLAERNACLGRRSAREHLAHLLCELLVRLTVTGQARGVGYTLPMTQKEIGDALGLTSVHVNRVLQSLRTEGLIEQRGRDLAIGKWSALRQAAAFRPDYLHLEGIDGEGHDFSAAPWAFAATP